MILYSQEDIVQNRKLDTELYVDDLSFLRAKITILQNKLGEYFGISRQTLSSIELKKLEIAWYVFLSFILFFTLHKKNHTEMKLVLWINETLCKCFNYDGRL